MRTPHLWAFGRRNVAAVASLVALAGCNIDYRVNDVEEEGSAGMGGSADDPSLAMPGPDGSVDFVGAAGVGGAMAIPPAPPEGTCARGGTCEVVAISNIDKVDLLFMVDNSGSMAEEQAALRAQFPKLLRVLTTGDLENGGDTSDFPPANDLHLGVVSSDMGLVGIDSIPQCNGLGDDGILNDQPSLEIMGCSEGYPHFLTFTNGIDDVNGTANDLACLATLGTDGCGFEQQLESALKALWPADDSRATFLEDPMGFGLFGHGDAVMGGAPGVNAGFLRNDAVRGTSLIAIIVVTDEDDCSSSNTAHQLPNHLLDPNDPLAQQGLNTRCHHNPQNLYEVQRYINAFKALRPGQEHLVVFGTIAGVPPETVASVPADFSTNPMAREAFYDGITSHPAMQPMVDTMGTPDVGDDNLVPSCNTAIGKAYPPTRIVEVARGFGKNGVVQSICNDDLGPAMDAITARIAAGLGAVCLPRPLVRGPDGLVECDVIWELPTPGAAPMGTPIECMQASDFLLAPARGAERSPTGGALCRVAQLSVRGAPTQFVPTEVEGQLATEGWYYDDFSPELASECADGNFRRVAFSPAAKPPTGVQVYLDCAPM